MTTSVAHEVDRRRARGPVRHRSPFAALAAVAERVARRGETLTWPSPKYRGDPVAFCNEILGDKPWAKQIEILEAVRDHKRVAVASGHKVGKSRCAAWVAFWFFCSFPDARVVMSSTTSRQVDQILWREVRMMHARSTVPLGGEPRELARTGLKADDFREIVGFTAREAEAVAGISGANLLYILDEASGIDDAIYEAIEGNRAGGARLVMFSNPTKTDGEFFEAFHSKSEFYKTITVSSEETPNATTGRNIIPGLATREWIDEKRQEWGDDSPLYKIRVRGEFVLAEQGKIVSAALIIAATARWPDTKAEGRLRIGIDPAGPGEGGDESGFAVRRGQKVIEVIARRGLSDDGHLAELLGIISKYKTQHEPPAIISIDCEGLGRPVFLRLRHYAAEHPDLLEVYGIRASERAYRERDTYGTVRDELWANLRLWLREGGAIPDDVKLAKELHAPEFKEAVNGLIKATPKSELRGLLDRSPDRADAVALALWDRAAESGIENHARPRIDLYDPPTEIDAYTLDGLGGDVVYG